VKKTNAATARVHKKTASRDIRLSKSLTAEQSIGDLKKNQDIYILTFGQFSLIDALVHVLKQTGPAYVDLSTWTAADAHLEKAKALLDSAEIKRLRMVIDRSFESRQPEYCYHMRKRFGQDSIRAIRTHAKFFVVRNENWSVVARTSMNLNENPRLENIEISTDDSLSDFMTTIVDEIFNEVPEGANHSPMLELLNIEQQSPYNEVKADHIKNTQTIQVSHELKKG
jgi:hypothetical protein